MAQIVTSNLQSRTDHPIVIQDVGNCRTGIKSYGFIENVSYYHTRLAAVFGSLHFFFGVLSISFYAAAQQVDDDFYSEVFGYYGYWMPVLWFLAGGFGLATACVKNKCLIITFMTMSIIAAFSIILYLAFAGLELRTSVYYEEDYYDDDEDLSKKIPLDSVLIAVGVFEGLVSIFSAIICCNAVCCGASQTTVTIEQILNQAHTRPEATEWPLPTRGLASIRLQGVAPSAQAYHNNKPPPNLYQ